MSVSSSSSRAPSRGSGPGAMKQKPNTANNAEGNISVSPDGDDEFDDHRPLSQSGTRWTRFFPELSSHFSLVSPVSSRHQSTSSYGTIAISQYSRHSRQSSHDLGDISEPKTGSSSQCSTELVDDASSCYSRRSSVTSLGSEFSPSAYKSAGAYSITSPAMAGVFDDSESLYRSGSTRSRASRRSRKSIKRTPSARNKPLPCPPPIQMKPLSIRHKHRYPRQHEPTICEDTLDEGCESSLTVNLRPQSQLHKQRRHHPTLSQAAEDLEDALAGLVERNYKEETGIYSPYVSSPVATTATTSMPRLDTPLQVSRGNMDMIATRPAPSPPTGHRKSGSSGSSSSSSSSKKSLKKGLLPAQTEETMKHAKKPHKDKGRGPFSFNMSLPSFGALKAKAVKNRDDGHFRSHRRSMSGSGLLQRAARQEVRPSTASTPEEAENKNEAVGSAQLLSVPVRAQRSASVSSERELRLKLPRLQTKEVQPSGMLCQAQPSTKSAINISAADEALQEKEIVPQPQSRRRSNTLSLNSQGTMPNNQPTGTGTSVPIGQYEMPTSTTTFNSNAEPVYELDAGLPEQQIKSPVAPSPFVPSGQMPGILPDEIVELILRRCNQLQDLFNFAVMNRQFYRVFKQRELDLIQNTVYAMSPPAWELREMSPPWDSEWQVLFDLDAPVPEYTQSLYLDRYTRDLYTLVKLKSLILARCSTFLRPETIRGLAGQDDTRAAEIDDAFWRVWTFCRIFGCGKGREGDIVGQLDWLNGGIMAKNQQRSMAMSISEPFGINDVLFQPPEGFGLGNKGGLSQGQLYDMTEIWTCLGVLLQPIHSKCEEARKAGVFDGHDVANKDSVKEEATLEEWTSYVLTLGPSAVLALASIATVDNADEIFQRAQSLGLTKWEEADASRSSFFRDAVSKAYRPQTSARRLHPLHQTGSNSSRSSAESNSSPSDNLLTSDPQRRRQAAYAVQLRNRRNQNGDRPNPGVEERPISSYVEIMNRLAGAPPHPLYQQIPPLPTSTPTPEYNPSPQPRAASPPQHRVPTAGTPNTQVPQARAPRAAVSLLQPQVLDPTDQAMDMIVNELGFSAEDAKWALKITDTGEGINVNAAVSLLIQEYNRPSLVPSARSSADASSYGHVYSPPLSVYQGQHCNSILSSVMQRPDAAASGWRWA
ncbi:uncharacterized protein APUU_10628A [Aspergillus puulaauensis]|uniref:F-box domain protein n=1 Tax=Aspergillus puulaauensis TaxID=1220207 RepID=A0A7R8AHP1_9EURO|nr:uncharacterized protein APUU_10628A [Aspergillus puulaauensis]BCS17800.1 hypothetical protein APUU_10628A [Aspergillus puulaauensis]